MYGTQLSRGLRGLSVNKVTTVSRNRNLHRRTNHNRNRNLPSGPKYDLMRFSWAPLLRLMMLIPVASVKAPPNPMMLWYVLLRSIVNTTSSEKRKLKHHNRLRLPLLSIIVTWHNFDYIFRLLIYQIRNIGITYMHGKMENVKMELPKYIIINSKCGAVYHNINVHNNDRSLYSQHKFI